MKFLYCLLPVILLLPNLSGAQKITVSDPKGQPVNQAIVFIQPLEGGKKQVIITDATGSVTADPVLKKVQVVVSHLSFEYHVDTLPSLNSDIKISLVKKNVDLGEVVVTSEYAARTTSESIHPVTIINKEQIENQAAPNLEALLSQQLSMRINPDKLLGAGLTMNGISGQNIKILVDGVPVIGRLDGNIDLGQINLNNVERIEVVNGPMATSYGTDAAGGVINLITRQAIDQTYQAGINFQYESIGQYNVDGFAGVAKGRSAFLMSGGRNYFDGWSSYDTGRWQEWKPKEQYFGDLKYRYSFRNLVLNYQFGAFNETLSNKGSPRISPYFAYAFDEYYTTLRITNQLIGNYVVNKNVSVNASVSNSIYNRTKNTYRKDLVTLSETILPGADAQDTTLMNSWLGRIVFNRAKTNGILNYQAGIDILSDHADGSRFNNEGQQYGDYAFFASAEIRATKKLEVKPGVRMAYNTDYNAPVIPSIMLKYDFGKTVQARISYGKGYRAPGLKERYLYFVDINHDIHGNENLEPEYSDNFYLAVNKRSVIGKTTHNTQLNGFYNDIRNLITLAQPDPNASLFTYINIGSFSTHGGNISHGISWKNLTVNVGAGVTGRYNIYADSGNFKTYLYSPDFNTNVQYLFGKINLSAAVYFKYNGKLPGYRLNSDNTITQFSNDSYRFLDASLRKGFFKKKLFVATGIKNILNITHVNGFTQGSAHSATENEQALGTGRTYFIRMQYVIGK